MEKDYNKVFEEAYGKLNKAQKEAVDEIDGPVMVIAGPGTGKTQILTMRIANICRKTDTEPENILALTFTEAAASSMKRRLVDLMGPGGYQVMISTFHGFANDVIKNFPEEFPRLIGAELLDDVTRIKFLREVIAALPLEKLKSAYDPDHYLKAINGAINDLKREGVSVDEFAEIIKGEKEGFELIADLYNEKGVNKGKKKTKYIELEKRIAKGEELVGIYREYEKKLQAERYYDYNDMLMEALRALKENDDLLLSIQERYQYILVDEHQDTNKTQNRIVELIASFHDNPNVFIVGDEKQAIYRFQGASLENFTYFQKLYPKSKLVFLEENYRSTQTILDSAHSVLAGKRPLLARSGSKDEKIRICSFTNPYSEIKFVAEDIKSKIASGVLPEEIAILYRENKDSREMSEMLSRYKIPFVIDPGESILYDHLIRKIIVILKAIDAFGSQKELIEAMHIDCFRIDQFDIVKILSAVSADKTSIFDILEDDDVLSSLKLKTERRIKRFYSFLKHRSAEKENVSLLKLYENVIKKSGLMRQVINRGNSIQDLEKINGLFKELKRFIQTEKSASLAKFLEHLEIMKENGFPLSKMVLSPETKKVRLMTAHKSKGLEFGYVYLINAVTNSWEGKRQRNLLPLPAKVYSLWGDKDLPESDKPEDERRLFYVALTRSKIGMTVTYSKFNEEGREQLPTVFVSEMRQDLLDYEDMSGYERDVSAGKELAFGKVEKKAEDEVLDQELIKEIVLKRGFSPTDINNYLDCPWKYFYANLLRIPQTVTKSSAYGTAIHAALADYFEHMQNGKEMSAEETFESFKASLGRQPITDSDKKELMKKGEKSLISFINHYAGTWEKNFLTETPISGGEIDGIPIKGRIDRIELLNNGKVRVIDFKTGKYKTMGQIIGTTKDSNGQIKRQIVFYKLLLQQLKERKYVFDYGTVDFVEPDDKGDFHRENLVPDEEDVKKLTDEIKFVYDEVTNLKFWNKRCDDPKCEYCQMRDLRRDKPMEIESQKYGDVDNSDEE